jgi:hypothetical protein
MWVLVPTPPEPKNSLPGCALASAISSATLFAFTAGFTTITCGTERAVTMWAKLLRGSNGNVGTRPAAIAYDTSTATSVWPSGAARATEPQPMAPAPPVRFSTTVGCPSAGLTAWATMRATVSVLPPGANGTTKVTGREG